MLFIHILISFCIIPFSVHYYYYFPKYHVNVFFPTFTDIVSYFSYVAKSPFNCHTTNIATFIVLRHPVPILVTDFTNLHTLTNELLILDFLIINKLLVSLWCDWIGNISWLQHWSNMWLLNQPSVFLFSVHGNF